MRHCHRCQRYHHDFAWQDPNGKPYKNSTSHWCIQARLNHGLKGQIRKYGKLGWDFHDWKNNKQKMYRTAMAKQGRLSSAMRSRVEYEFDEAEETLSKTWDHWIPESTREGRDEEPKPETPQNQASPQYSSPNMSFEEPSSQEQSFHKQASQDASFQDAEHDTEGSHDLPSQKKPARKKASRRRSSRNTSTQKPSYAETDSESSTRDHSAYASSAVSPMQGPADSSQGSSEPTSAPTDATTSPVQDAGASPPKIIRPESISAMRRGNKMRTSPLRRQPGRRPVHPGYGNQMNPPSTVTTPEQNDRRAPQFQYLHQPIFPNFTPGPTPDPASVRGVGFQQLPARLDQSSYARSADSPTHDAVGDFPEPYQPYHGPMGYASLLNRPSPPRPSHGVLIHPAYPQHAPARRVFTAPSLPIAPPIAPMANQPVQRLWPTQTAVAPPHRDDTISRTPSADSYSSIPSRCRHMSDNEKQARRTLTYQKDTELDDEDRRHDQALKAIGDRYERLEWELTASFSQRSL